MKGAVHGVTKIQMYTTSARGRLQQTYGKHKPHLDPLHFAYRPGRGVYNVTGALLNMILTHLEGVKNT